MSRNRENASVGTVEGAQAGTAQFEGRTITSTDRGAGQGRLFGSGDAVT